MAHQRRVRGSVAPAGTIRPMTTDAAPITATTRPAGGGVPARPGGGRSRRQRPGDGRCVRSGRGRGRRPGRVPRARDLRVPARGPAPEGRLRRAQPACGRRARRPLPRSRGGAGRLDRGAPRRRRRPARCRGRTVERRSGAPRRADRGQLSQAGTAQLRGVRREALLRSGPARPAAVRHRRGDGRGDGVRGRVGRRRPRRRRRRGGRRGGGEPQRLAVPPRQAARARAHAGGAARRSPVCRWCT